MDCLCRARRDPCSPLVVCVPQKAEDDLGVHPMDPPSVRAVLQGEGGGHPLPVGYRARNGHRARTCSPCRVPHQVTSAIKTHGSIHMSYVCCLQILRRCLQICTRLMSLNALLPARLANRHTFMGPCPGMCGSPRQLAHICVLCSAIASPSLLSSSPIRVNPTSHPSRRRLSSMVWLSTTTCTSRRPHRRLVSPLLRSMRFSLQ